MPNATRLQPLIAPTDIADKITHAELLRLRLRFTLERCQDDADIIRSHIADSNNRRKRAAWRCPYDADDVRALRQRAADLTELATEIADLLHDKGRA